MDLAERLTLPFKQLIRSSRFPFNITSCLYIHVQWAKGRETGLLGVQVHDPSVATNLALDFATLAAWARSMFGRGPG